MALIVGGTARSRPSAPTSGAAACSAPTAPGRCRSVAGVSRGRQQRQQHLRLPRGRGLAPLAGHRRPTRSRSAMWPVVARPSTSCSTAAARRRDRLGQIARPGRRAGGAAGRLVEHPPRSLRAGASPTCRRPAAGVGARGRAARPRDRASIRTCSWTSRRTRWTGTTRCSAARCAAPRPRPASTTRWDDFVVPRARHPLRRRQPVGDRRRDLRAGDGAGRAGRPRARARAVRRHAAPARRATAPTGPAWSTPTASAGRSSTPRTPPPR